MSLLLAVICNVELYVTVRWV